MKQVIENLDMTDFYIGDFYIHIQDNVLSVYHKDRFIKQTQCRVSIHGKEYIKVDGVFFRLLGDSIEVGTSE